jgi:uncharacterized protein (UPF0332 family)
MSLQEESRREIVKYRIERAFTALEQAKLNVKINCLEVTANRLYYAAYYAVSSLLIAYQIPAHKHDGNIQQFGLHFVKTGIVSRELGKLLRQLFTMRLTGDYSDHFDLVEEDVLPKIEPTEQFVHIITGLAKEKLGLLP